jgi:two-component system CheB/CheR fusion protein
LQAKQQALDVRVSSDLCVHADPVRTEQIIWNLLSNAVKFTPEKGSITVQAEVEGAEVRIDVSDNGVGIARDELTYIFDMFHQIETGAARARGGMGIGLALVKQLAELQGGRVHAASEGPGKGSVFSVWLPRDKDDSGFGSLDLPDPSLTGLRVLVVDDESATLAAFGQLLTLDGAAVSVVDGAEKALVAVERETFDLIISDLAMPGRDGFWLIGQLRQRPASQHLPCIAVSGMGRPSDRERALAAGFDTHLAKPLRMDALRQTVARLLPAG